MADDTKPIASETDLALISFARVVLDVLYATNLVRPEDVDPLLAVHEKGFEKMEYPIAAGILAMIRQLAGDPERERMRENLRRLIQERAKGSA